jgi:hypothetical protein
LWRFARALYLRDTRLIRYQAPRVGLRVTRLRRNGAWLRASRPIYPLTALDRLVDESPASGGARAFASKLDAREHVDVGFGQTIFPRELEKFRGPFWPLLDEDRSAQQIRHRDTQRLR